MSVGKAVVKRGEMCIVEGAADHIPFFFFFPFRGAAVLFIYCYNGSCTAVVTCSLDLVQHSLRGCCNGEDQVLELMSSPCY